METLMINIIITLSTTAITSNMETILVMLYDDDL